MTARYHKSVMLNECVEALNIHPEGVYVDATFGGGGHSLALLEKLKGGRLIAFDQDRNALEEAKRITHRSFSFHEANFIYMKRYLRLDGIEKVNGVLADLGVSSHQIDTAKRGFSTRYDGPLDMRMDNNTSPTATEVINTYTEEKLCKLFRDYGEIRNAKALTQSIVHTRRRKKIMRSADLLELLQPLAPQRREFKYYAQVFQALRIEVNSEMDALEVFMRQCEEVLEVQGRLAVISYHSLEDRMVKRFMRNGTLENEPPKDLYGHTSLPFRALNRKPIVPQEKEILENNRARSAKLRVAERVQITAKI